MNLFDEDVLLDMIGLHKASKREALLLDLYEGYTNRVRSRLADVIANASASNVAVALSRVHAIKSASLVIGSCEIYRLADIIEKALETGNFSRATATVPEIEVALEKIDSEFPAYAKKLSTIDL